MRCRFLSRPTRLEPVWWRMIRPMKARKNDLANICQRYGSTLLQLKKPREALPFFERGIEILARHMKDTPGDTNTAANLAITRVWTSDCRKDLLKGDVEGARKCYRSGLEIAEKLPSQNASYSTLVVVDELRESEAKIPR